MNQKIFDVIIVGLGGIGSSAAYHLSSKGLRSMGLERFEPAHDHGSSHGESRIIRKAYFEHPSYVPLLHRSFELWSELEEKAGFQIHIMTGGVMIGSESSMLIKGCLRSSNEHGLEHEILSSQELKERFPPFELSDEMVGFYEKSAGVLFPEKCIEANLKLAMRNGMSNQFEEEVQELRLDTNPLEVVTNKSTYRTRKLVLCAGAWLKKLLPGLLPPLKVERKVMHWFKTHMKSHHFHPDHFPIYAYDAPDGTFLYGFPALDEHHREIKFAIHNDLVEESDPDSLNRAVSTEEILQVRSKHDEILPGAAGDHLKSLTCMYTLTRDQHFLLGCLNQNQNVIIAGGFSGHGFKFASVMGEIIADLVCENPLNQSIELFNLNRFK